MSCPGKHSGTRQGGILHATRGKEGARCWYTFALLQHCKQLNSTQVLQSPLMSSRLKSSVLRAKGQVAGLGQRWNQGLWISKLLFATLNCHSPWIAPAHWRETLRENRTDPLAAGWGRTRVGRNVCANSVGAAFHTPPRRNKFSAYSWHATGATHADAISHILPGPDKDKLQLAMCRMRDEMDKPNER